MFSFDQIPTYLHDPEEMARQQAVQMERLADYQEQLAAAAGTAESEDGEISLTFSEEKGLQNLRIDPRAFRDGSEDLATQIQDLVNQARTQLQQKQVEIARSTFGDTVDPAQLLADMPEMQAQLGELMNITRETGNDVGMLVERIQRAFPTS
ncbi:YbaB/EbfC family nucleoid-associated protein [Flindersiella endophytica]